MIITSGIVIVSYDQRIRIVAAKERKERKKEPRMDAIKKSHARRIANRHEHNPNRDPEILRGKMNTDIRGWVLCGAPALLPWSLKLWRTSAGRSSRVLSDVAKGETGRSRKRRNIYSCEPWVCDPKNAQRWKRVRSGVWQEHETHTAFQPCTHTNADSFASSFGSGINQVVE
jgi:hypothetical protein